MADPPVLTEAHLQAMERHRAGRLDEAEQLYRTVLRAAPRFPDANHNLGILLLQRGRAEHALPHFEAALSAVPTDKQYWQSYIEALLSAGQAEAAFHALEQAKGHGLSGPGLVQLEDRITVPPVLAFDNGRIVERALGHHRAGRLGVAGYLYRKILTIDPAASDALHMLGMATHQQGRNEPAVCLIDRALHVDDAAAIYHSNKGIVLFGLGRLDDAIESYQAALRRQPIYADAWSNLANSLYRLERLTEAAAAARKSLCIEPGFSAGLNNLAIVRHELGELSAAMTCFQWATQVKADHAEARFKRSFLHLLEGDMARGWRDYEWRNKGGADFYRPRGFPQPQWQGEDISGKTILLHAEQGLGDSIQFCRFVALVAARGARVVFEVPSALHRLLEDVAGTDRILRYGEVLPPFDLHCPLMSVPGALGIELETIPHAVPYLAAEPAAVERWRHRLGNHGFKVGIVWQGNPASPSERGRSAPLAGFASLAQIPGVRLISLQKRHGLDQLDDLPSGMIVERLGEDFDEGPDAFIDTAAVMACLDLVITVDTATGHLAGALGRPTWLLLKAVPHWVWMLGRDDSPWYPSIRLFRQNQRGDWSSPVARMAEELVRTISVMPDSEPNAASMFDSALSHHRRGRVDLAVSAYRAILASFPAHDDSLHLLGMAEHGKGNIVLARSLVARALSLLPQASILLSNLGIILFDLGDFAAAADCYQRALRLQPDFVNGWSNLANVLYRLGQLGAAKDCARNAIAIAPNIAAAYNNFGTACHERGELDQAADAFCRGVAVSGGSYEAAQNRLFIELYRPQGTLASIASLSREWAARYADPWRREWVEPAQPEIRREPRIALLSGDFLDHPVGRLVLPAVESLADLGKSFTLYSNSPVEDIVTGRFRRMAGQWRHIAGLPDQAAYDQIRDDAIDILIDLSGHSFLNRALLMARKPAPIQIAWAVGYPATTGLAAYDYLIADGHQVPDGTEDWYSERLIRLPHSYVAFAPPSDAPEILSREGPVTFGSFNALKKITSATIDAWSEILKRQPESRLLVKSVALSCDNTRRLFLARFAARGIPDARLILVGKSPSTAHLATMAECDIALDSFPYSGGMTTLDCLWQGLPVITLPGQTFCSRHALGYLTTIGLGELAAVDEKSYIDLALDWAQDRGRLASFRAGIRMKMLSSPLCDAVGFSRTFRAALDLVWHRFCDGSAPIGLDLHHH